MKPLHYLIPLILLSCTTNHSHDGKYKAAVFTNASLTWVNDQEIELEGNTMDIKALSVVDTTILAEFKTTCKQFDDRIEFKGKDGVTVVARFDKDGNLKYGEYIYEKINDEGHIEHPHTIPDNDEREVKESKEAAYMSTRDSVQMLYNDALSRLDSITGTNDNLQEQLSDRNSEISKIKSEINSILKKRNATQDELVKAKQLIGELNKKIHALEIAE
jgi:superfamily I DNA and RNA helicase